MLKEEIVARKREIHALEYELCTLLCAIQEAFISSPLNERPIRSGFSWEACSEKEVNEFAKNHFPEKTFFQVCSAPNRKLVRIYPVDWQKRGIIICFFIRHPRERDGKTHFLWRAERGYVQHPSAGDLPANGQFIVWGKEIRFISHTL